MSNIYIQEPPTSGKVVMTTTVGDIEIELWSKEAPLACRNFVQLCMEGYYDKTIFHRLVPSFVVQGGDPSGTGFGGESVYGGPFRDELHTRLRFVRRGLLAMANSGEKNSNGSQFFFTLGATPDLENKHTIFGKIAGDTIYNLLKFSDMEVDANERPVYPQKILRTEVLTNPFPDIEPRNLKPDEDKVEIVQVTSKARATKNFGLLSFGDEAEDEEEQSTSAASIFSAKPKSSHDLTNDPRLSSQSVLQDVMDLPADDGDFHTSNRQHEKPESRSASPASDVPRVPSELDDKVSALRVTKRKAAELMEELTKPREKKSEVSRVKPETGESDETVADYKRQLDKYESRKRKKGENREDTILQRLQKFKHILKTSVSEAGDEPAQSPPENEVEVETGTTWMKNKLSFEEERLVLAKDASMKADDWYELYDPRNPINKRKRETKAKDSSKRQNDTI